MFVYFFASSVKISTVERELNFSLHSLEQMDLQYMPSNRNHQYTLFKDYCNCSKNVFLKLLVSFFFSFLYTLITFFRRGNNFNVFQWHTQSTINSRFVTLNSMIITVKVNQISFSKS